MPYSRTFKLPLIRDVVRFGQEPGDDERTRGLKAMATIVVVALMLLSISMLPQPGRSPFLRLLDLVVITIELQALWRFWRGRTLEVMFYAFVPGYFAFMAVSSALNGMTEGDPLALLIIPSAAVVMLGPNRALPWLGVALLTQLGLHLVEPVLPYWQSALAVTAENPEGFIFYNPAKKPLGSTEVITFATGTALLFFMFRSAHLQLTRARDEVAAEKARGDRLMATIYPPAVLDELKQAGSERIVEELAEASVLFADLEGFTRFSEAKSPAALVAFLERLFAEFDRLAERHGAEKIKTMGDGYLAAAGLHGTGADHAETLCALGRT